MPKTFNPFDDWLGLGPQVVNPHHFQLLNVKPTLTHPDEIKAAVQSGVQRNLARLAKIPPGTNDLIVEKLKRRIQLAQDTLLDPEKRQVHLLRIKKKAAEDRSATRFKGDPVGNQSPVETPAIKGRPAAEATPEIRDRKTPPRRQEPRLRKAVPLGVRDPTGSLPESDGKNQPGISNLDSTPATDSEGRPGEFSIKTATRRKRRGPLMPIVLGFATLVAAGLAYWVYYHFDSLLVQGGLFKSPPIVQNESTDLPITAPDVAADPDTVTASKAAASNGVWVPPIPPSPEPPADSPAEMVDHANPHPPIGSKASVPDDPPIAAEPVFVELTDAEQVLFRRSIERAHRSLTRNDVAMARRETKRAAEILQIPVVKPGSQLVPHHESLSAIVESTDAIADFIDRFWEQVAKSCQGIPGGQEIVVNGQVLAFVEADASHVMLRNAGTNINYPYHSLRPGLAIVLANQGAVDDVAVWSIQQAALYAVNRTTPAEHSEKIQGLLAVAETFGHDCTEIRHFIEFEFGGFAFPSSLPVYPSEVNSSWIKRFRKDHGYTSPGTLAPAKAANLFENLFHLDPSSQADGLAQLSESLQLAIRSGDASRVEDAVIELSNYSGFERPGGLCDSFLKLSNVPLSDQQYRELIERAIPFLKSNDGRQASDVDRKKLADRLQQRAESLEMFDALRRLDQLE